MNSDQLYDYASCVNSRADFINFTSLLHKNFMDHEDSWDNKNLPDFLNGLSSFARDMAGYYTNMGEEVDVDVVTWRMTAQMLLAASVYGS